MPSRHKPPSHARPPLRGSRMPASPAERRPKRSFAGGNSASCARRGVLSRARPAGVVGGFGRSSVERGRRGSAAGQSSAPPDRSGSGGGGREGTPSVTVKDGAVGSSASAPRPAGAAAASGMMSSASVFCGSSPS